MFPHDTVPDGHVAAPHHFYIGIIIVAIALAVVWDDQKADAVVSLSALCGALFGFAFVWPFYPAVGALLTLAATAVVPVALLYERHIFSRAELAGACVGWIIAADDVLEHAFGVSTPLDILFVKYLLPAIQFVEQMA